jgi:hypothetical protein
MSRIRCADGADEMISTPLSCAASPQKYPDSKKNLLPLTTQSLHGRSAGFQIKLREFFLRFGRG